MLRLLEVAQAELDEAIDWYNDLAPNLGDAFLLEAINGFRQIERHPRAWHPLEGAIRRFRLSRFP